ncbi:hypothetical protein [Actinophytocola xinjiangensis]|nr:hypothetical protein [Actinophytocola xinjiangensis]
MIVFRVDRDRGRSGGPGNSGADSPGKVPRGGLGAVAGRLHGTFSLRGGPACGAAAGRASAGPASSVSVGAHSEDRP